MIEKIFILFSFLPKEIALAIISMIPLIEERGAIIFGAGINMAWYKVLPICLFFNMVPIPFLLLFGSKIIEWLKTTKLFGKFFTKYDEKLHQKKEKLEKYGFFALTIFTALPIPGTGAWSATLISTMLGFNIKKGFLSILLGVSICAIIMTLASYGVVGFLSILL